MSLIFINELENTHDKVKYQRALIKLGIEHIRVAVPFAEYDSFVNALNENISVTTKFKSKKILEIVTQFKGFVEK